jgi:hypothetical protein
MKIYFALIAILLVSANVNSQENIRQKPLSIGLTFGFETTQFIGYERYKRDGGYTDEDFKILGKNGNGFHTKIETIKSIDGRNAVSVGLGITILQFNVDSISGGIGRILDTKKLLIPSLNLQLSHIYTLKSEGYFNISLENSIALTKNTKFSDYNLKEINLIWRPGINLEKTLSLKNSLIFEIDYGFGILNLSENERYGLRNNGLGLNLGISRQL